MLAQSLENVRTAALGLLSGGVAVLLVCALLSRTTPVPAQGASPTQTQPLPEPRVIPCVYDSLAQPTEAPPQQTETVSPASDDVSIYGPMGVIEPSEHVARAYPAFGDVPQTASFADRADLSCYNRSTQNCTTTAAGQHTVEQSAADAPRKPSSDVPSSTCDTSTTEVEDGTDRVCSLRDGEGSSVVATVKMAGRIVSETLAAPDHAADDAQHSPSQRSSKLSEHLEAKSADVVAEAYQAPTRRYFCQPVGLAPGSHNLANLPSCEVSPETTSPGVISVRFDPKKQAVLLETKQARLEAIVAKIRLATGARIAVADDLTSLADELVSVSVEGPTVIEALRLLLGQCDLVLSDAEGGYRIAGAERAERCPAEHCPDVAEKPCFENPVRQVSFSASSLPTEQPKQKQQAIAACLPQPWEIVESGIANERPQTLSMPPGIMSATVEPGELEIARQARLLIAEGSLNETIDLLGRGVAQYPQSAMLFRMLGEAYMWRADYAAASQALEHSISLNKMDPLTNNLFAEALMKLGQDVRADHYLHQASDAQRSIAGQR